MFAYFFGFFGSITTVKKLFSYPRLVFFKVGFQLLIIIDK